MSDEENFYRALINSGCYSNLNVGYKIKHPSEPSNFISLDNIGYKNNTLFVFEGKSGKPEKAFGQLRTAYLSMSDPFYKRAIINYDKFENYSKIRLFYYSFKRGLLIEYNPSMVELKQHKFRDLNELADILRNI